jgi:hypothetical protein
MDATTTVSPTRVTPFLGLRVSWGALLAGALVMLASATLLYVLGLAIVLIAMHPDQWQGATVALWIIGICSVLIGAALGGLSAGWLTGSGVKRIGAMHGFLSWSLAFLVSLAFAMALFFGLLRFAGNTVVSTAGAAATGAAAAPAGSVMTKAVQTLEGLGYSPAEANRMVSDAQRQIQRSLRGNKVTPAQAEATLDDIFNYVGGAIWIFWATWLVAMLLALLCGAIASTWALRRPVEPLVEREPLPPGYAPPLTPREV